MALTKVSRGLLSTSIEDNGNATAITIDSLENVGIGTSSPVNTLSIKGSVNQLDIETSTAGVTLESIDRSDLNAQSDLSYYARHGNHKFFNSAYTQAMTIDSSGNVGIGTTSPSTKLTVSGSVRALRSDDATQYGDFAQDSSGGYISTHRPHASLYENFRFLASNNSGSVERMRIDSSGNLRLTGTAPSSEDNISTINFFNTSSGLNLASIEGKRTAGGTNYGSLIFNTTSSGTSAERMRIDSSGNVGIGTSSPQKTLDVKGTFAISNSTTSYWDFDRDDSDGSLKIADTGTERARIDSSGRLLVGTTSGSDKINVYQAAGGTICTLESAGTAGAYALQFKNPNGTVGNVTVSGTTTSYNTSSDQRLKENIADANDAGSKIDAIQVRQYDWKADGSHQDYGMIAQELQTVAPEAVSAPEDPDEMMGVDYSKLVPMLIKEIQSLRNRVAQLEE